MGHEDYRIEEPPAPPEHFGDDLKQDFLDELRARGCITAACEKIGLSRLTVIEGRNSDPHFDQRVKEVLNTSIDDVETMVMFLAANGSREVKAVAGKKVEYTKYYPDLMLRVLAKKRPEVWGDNPQRSADTMDMEGQERKDLL